MASSGSEPGKGKIRACLKKLSREVPEKGPNLCEYPKMASFGSVPGKCRIRASVEKLSRGIPEKGPICVSTEKCQNQGQYRENVESVRVSKKDRKSVV